MIELLISGLTLTFAYLLVYRIKSRQWRHWLGIVITASGALACFNLPFRLYETNVGLVYIFSCFIGLFLIADSERFEDDDTTL